ncbi:outer membrane protein OmpW [Vibrio sp. 10N.261.46.E12]|uniref:outer membrane protein OmpW n=1 Tax=unclassified Vibrio TaxID=2614977 RepID=UPI00097732F8|nr:MULTISPECIES: outer membrane protein OmpW [unclassified Vibrio]OMO34149.1 outer membrane protein OmpW [Vibrio sp. 10N.261.45.E1]PMJ21115.1 outer membrane protein OmpW [Vibrio sp. 10N.286.45.B6]PML84047.1 outer membrane protein OmpW [Vibrio sp. 10N.261.49.E11]PMM67650.1 outer membrane protein OmpW [Vibrio sp. 10N.261.46.F12]PMM86518.1 outer membrane protein OmpW [Vibrio sp. 10N.261.46.E8]
MKKTVCGLAVITALMSTNVLAHKEGDFIIRAGAATVSPNDSSGAVLDNSDLEFSLDSDTQLGLTFGYMFTDNISFEVLAASPFSHNISVNGLGKVADTKHLPPTFMVQYYFGQANSDFRPYVGAGINYTVFFDESLNGTGKSAGLSDLSLDDSWGLAANIGIDYMINEDWFLNASVWYADIGTTAKYKQTVGGTTTQYSTDVDIDPWVFMIGGGYNF